MSGIMSMVLGAKTAIAAAVDAYFNLVTLLLPGNGTNGAQNNTFLDSSTNNFTITRNGNTTQGTFSPFSQTGWSNYFGASSTYLSFGSNSAFGFSTGAYTVEFWYYPTALSGLRWLCSNDASGGINIYLDGNQLNWGYWGAGGFILVNNAFNLNQWNHVALCRASTSSNQASVFINGTRAANGTDSRDWTVNGPFVIGGSSQSSNSLDGYISNLRVVKGTDVYGVSNTSYTVPTTPLTAITNTSLLTCQSNRFRDNSSNAFAVTVNGSPSVQAFSPFAPTAAYSASTNGGSGYFDGTGDYLTSSGDFFSGQGTARTFQCWIYVVSLPGSGSSAGIFSGANSGGNLSFRFASDGTLNLDNTGTANIAASASGAIKAGQWTHVAVTRTTGNLYTLYVNGSSVGSGTNSTNMGSSTYLASLTGGSTLNGYMTDIRVTNTVETINVPTAPLTAISGTALLLNFTNAGITDATAKNDLETVGNAQISTTQSKFGGSSMYFDGTGDYLACSSGSANPLFNMGTGDYTVEFWMYSGTPGSQQVIFDMRSSDTSGQGFALNYTTSRTLVLYMQGNRITSSAISANTWTHIAVVRASGTYTMYVDGASAGTWANSDTVAPPANRPYIGADAGGSQNYNGYIDDLRITKGYARYTGNFTPPTQAFALQ